MWPRNDVTLVPLLLYIGVELVWQCRLAQEEKGRRWTRGGLGRTGQKAIALIISGRPRIPVVGTERVVITKS